MKKAFTLLEILVVIALMALVAGLAASNFSFVENASRRPPKAVLMEGIKLARVAAADAGEEVSMYFDPESRDIVLRTSFDGRELARMNLFSMDAQAREKMARRAEETGEVFELPEASLAFYPVYPGEWGFSKSDAEGAETLPCIRFASDSTMTPARIELKIGEKTVASFEVDPFSGLPADKWIGDARGRGK